MSPRVCLNCQFPLQAFPMNYPAICVDVDIYEQVIRCGFTEKFSITARRAREKVQRDKRDENVKRNEGLKSCHF